VEELLQIAHARGNILGRGWNEKGVAWPSAADPVLRASEFPRALVTAATPGKENPVDFPDQAIRYWKSFAKSLQTMIECCDVVDNLLRIIDRYSGCFFQLIEEEVG
jgi:hypothetical protein